MPHHGLLSVAAIYISFHSYAIQQFFYERQLAVSDTTRILKVIFFTRCMCLVACLNMHLGQSESVTKNRVTLVYIN